MVVFKIRERLLLGSENDALMVDKRNKCAQVISPVTHILSITNQPPEWEKACLSGEISTLHIEAPDMPASDLLHYFDVCIDFIEGARRAGCVLVHCMYGVSRSPTVIAAYLMKVEKISCTKALESIASVKPSIKPNTGFMRQLHIWQDMKCCIDPTHKSYRSYRLGKLAKMVKETGQVEEALCASHDPVFSSHDSPLSSHDQDLVYKCRRCRKLLFTQDDVLPHEVGIKSFTHLQNWKSEKRMEQSIITTSASGNDCSVKEKGLIHEVTSLNLVRNIDRLSITNDATVNSVGAEKLKVAPPNSSDDKSSVSSNRTTGVTFDIPVTSSTAPQPTIVTAGNHGNCTSVFIDVVEWLSPLIIGQLDGKISCPKCSARLGSFSWSGARCSCGQWITPSFQIHKSKIDQCTPPKHLPNTTELTANSNSLNT